MTKIFVTDDHPIVRDGLIAVLETQDDFEIVGEAAGGEETLSKLAVLEADVLMLDLGMPDIDGLEVIKQLKEQKHPVHIIVFTIFDSDERILQSIKFGAKGYLLKGASRKEIFEAIRVVSEGGSLLQPAIASKLMHHMRHAEEQLSEREKEVLQLLGKGMKNKEIGKELFISERTVKFHVSAILSKMGAKNRTEAVRIGIDRHWIK